MAGCSRLCAGAHADILAITAVAGPDCARYAPPCRKTRWRDGPARQGKCRRRKEKRVAWQKAQKRRTVLPGRRGNPEGCCPLAICHDRHRESLADRGGCCVMDMSLDDIGLQRESNQNQPDSEAPSPFRPCCPCRGGLHLPGIFNPTLSQITANRPDVPSTFTKPWRIAKVARVPETLRKGRSALGTGTRSVQRASRADGQQEGKPGGLGPVMRPSCRSLDQASSAPSTNEKSLRSSAEIMPSWIRWLKLINLFQ